MTKTLSQDEILDTLIKSGNLHELVGMIESEWFECKKEPYRLQTLNGKQELAKDVTGLANARGGMILLGVRTEKDPTHRSDKVEEIRPFQKDFVEIEQYHSVLRDWVYPPLQHINIRWFPSASNKTKGIVAIRVPDQPLTLHPACPRLALDHGKGKITDGSAFGGHP